MQPGGRHVAPPGTHMLGFATAVQSSISQLRPTRSVACPRPSTRPGGCPGPRAARPPARIGAHPGGARGAAHQGVRVSRRAWTGDPVAAGAPPDDGSAGRADRTNSSAAWIGGRPALDPAYDPPMTDTHLKTRRRVVVDQRALAQAIGTRIRAARLAAQLTQQELAGDRYTKAYISALELGHAKPSMAALDYLRPARHDARCAAHRPCEPVDARRRRPPPRRGPPRAGRRGVRRPRGDGH